MRNVNAIRPLRPISIIDDFFGDPDAVVELSQHPKIDWTAKQPDEAWPGKRSQSLHNIPHHLFNSSCCKIIDETLNPFYIQKMYFEANVYFQKTVPYTNPDINNKGWIHSDSNFLLSAIIYLNKEPAPGTSFYKAKLPETKPIHTEIKKSFFAGNTENLARYNTALNENNNQYEKLTTVESRYNRCVIFDSRMPHKADGFGTYDSNNKERLTLVYFFSVIKP
jgi:hypothetical protein